MLAPSGTVFMEIFTYEETIGLILQELLQIIREVLSILKNPHNLFDFFNESQLIMRFIGLFSYRKHNICV